jgi:hypothetical protein
MIVVADTSPLNYLVLLGDPGLLYEYMAGFWFLMPF